MLTANTQIPLQMNKRLLVLTRHPGARYSTHPTYCHVAGLENGLLLPTTLEIPPSTRCTLIARVRARSMLPSSSTRVAMHVILYECLSLLANTPQTHHITEESPGCVVAEEANTMKLWGRRGCW